jgi:putative sterol carrier protein
MVDNIDSFFSTLEQKIDEKKTAGMKAVYQFEATGDGGGTWHVVMNDGEARVDRGPAPEPDITLTTTADDLLAIVNGKMSGQSAFLTGRLKIKGDMSLAMKLQNLFG